MGKRLRTVVVVAGIGVVAGSAHADIKNPAAKQAMMDALSACKSAQAAAANTFTGGELDDNDYVTWSTSRETILKLEPSATTDAHAGLAWSPATEWPKCERLFHDWETGAGASSKAVSSVCSTNVHYELTSLVGHPLTSHSLFARQYLEGLRYKMSHGGVGDVRDERGDKSRDFGKCSINDHFRRGWADLESQFKATEAQVAALEASHGVKFVKIERVGAPGTLSPLRFHYTDLKTGAEVVTDNPDKLPTAGASAGGSASASPSGGASAFPRKCVGRTGLGDISFTERGDAIELKTSVSHVEASCTRRSPKELECEYTRDGRSVGKSAVILDPIPGQGIGMRGNVGSHGPQWICIGR